LPRAGDLDLMLSTSKFKSPEAFAEAYTKHMTAKGFKVRQVMEKGKAGGQIEAWSDDAKEWVKNIDPHTYGTSSGSPLENEPYLGMGLYSQLPVKGGPDERFYMKLGESFARKLSGASSFIAERGASGTIKYRFGPSAKRLKDVPYASDLGRIFEAEPKLMKGNVEFSKELRTFEKATGYNPLERQKILRLEFEKGGLMPKGLPKSISKATRVLSPSIARIGSASLAPSKGPSVKPYYPSGSISLRPSASGYPSPSKPSARPSPSPPSGISGPSGPSPPSGGSGGSSQYKPPSGYQFPSGDSRPPSTRPSPSPPPPSEGGSISTPKGGPIGFPALGGFGGGPSYKVSKIRGQELASVLRATSMPKFGGKKGVFRL
jgi:hypothetical protein